MPSGLFDGREPILYAGEDSRWSETWFSPTGEPPAMCTVTMRRKGVAAPIETVVYWHERAQFRARHGDVEETDPEQFWCGVARHAAKSFGRRPA